MSSGSWPMPDPVDLERLREFSDGTSDGVRTLAALFLDELEQAHRALGRAAAANRSSELESIAHRAGGSAGACGASTLAGVLLHIESMARAGQMDQAARLLAQFEAELTAVQQFLQNQSLVER
jgi:HPt (histidine-containing phosphotransfer) domain-containing protein